MPFHRGTLALILAAGRWGVALVMTKALLQEAGPLTISVLRFLLAWLLLAPFASRQGYRLSLLFRPAFVLFGVSGGVVTSLGVYFSNREPSRPSTSADQPQQPPAGFREN